MRPFAGRLRPLGPVVERLSGVPTSVDLENAARYVFVSETTRRRAAAAGVSPASTGIAHSGIDDGFIDPAPERDWDWSLLYVGRIDERKGVQTAVAALAELPEAAVLTIVGGWDERAEAGVRAAAERLGVAGRVRFRGQLSRAHVRAAYADADAVVFPVIWDEPWGLVPIEAMARGRPVVATGRGGSGEYLRDGENALLFEAEDVSALARALRRLADDRELRRRLVARGLETAPLHTEGVFNASVLRELEAAAGAGGGAPGAAAPPARAESAP
jgi:glycosyltransferase involved in cell wall biosynthesis